jgi:hypothetical protein
MSLKSWKNEFYKTKANDNIETTILALEHSIKKWKGMLPENLAKHEMAFYDGNIRETELPREEFEISMATCSLCHKFFYTHGNCRKCPLKVHFKLECHDESREPFYVWMQTGNPIPMIETLEKCLALEQVTK